MIEASQNTFVVLNWEPGSTRFSETPMLLSVVEERAPMGALPRLHLAYSANESWAAFSRFFCNDGYGINSGRNSSPKLLLFGQQVAND